MNYGKIFFISIIVFVSLIIIFLFILLIKEFMKKSEPEGMDLTGSVNMLRGFRLTGVLGADF